MITQSKKVVRIRSDVGERGAISLIFIYNRFLIITISIISAVFKLFLFLGQIDFNIVHNAALSHKELSETNFIH